MGKSTKHSAFQVFKARLNTLEGKGFAWDKSFRRRAGRR